MLKAGMARHRQSPSKGTTAYETHPRQCEALVSRFFDLLATQFYRVLDRLADQFSEVRNTTANVRRPQRSAGAAGGHRAHEGHAGGFVVPGGGCRDAGEDRHAASACAKRLPLQHGERSQRQESSSKGSL